MLEHDVATTFSVPVIARFVGFGLNRSVPAIQKRYANTDYDSAITGRVVDKENTPIAGRVFCYERATGFLVGSTYSNANGDYIFFNLDDKKEYFVTAIDEDKRTQQENAVTQDLIAPI